MGPVKIVAEIGINYAYGEDKSKFLDNIYLAKKDFLIFFLSMSCI